ncbi:hypothetical protein P691DRAFT_807148 [Macrolepiota fuliginosa MF-IS2]|uniref:Uncharacterized protein n=1 Tax=Macrolepiota fuliginosa MF-IS2 TaxID=1400762 RepID=A0A9P5X4C3_9AGAR|nr:hypothetical protein P691DRAFT_807148 [Macrolepiota fuliginosa MF-IS2]
MASSYLTNTGPQSATEESLNDYEKAIYVTFGSIRIKVTDECSDIPKLQKILQSALIGFVKHLEESSEKAKSHATDIHQVRQLISRGLLDDEKSRIAFLQRAEEVLKTTERIFCSETRGGVRSFRNSLTAFQDSDVRKEQIAIKQKAAELENQQKRLGTAAFSSESVDAVGDAIAIAIPAEEYSGIASLLARLGITIIKNKGQGEIDRRMTELGQAQQDCSQAMKSINSFDAAAKSAFRSLEGCRMFPMSMEGFIYQLRCGLSMLRKPTIAMGPVSHLEDQWSKLFSIVNGYQITVSNILEAAPLFEERSMTVEVEAFGRRITGLYDIFNQLRTAEDIVEDAHRTLLLTKIHELSECIVEQLEKIQEVFIRWHTYSNSESVDTFYFIPDILDMTCNIGSFSWSVQPLYAHIKLILREGFHRKKAKKAQEKREKEQRTRVHEILGFQCLVNEAEALGVLEQVDVILKGITQFSTELGAALLYFDGRRSGSVGRAAVGSAPQSSSHYPKNPFKVPREITEQVMSTLGSETSRLSQLPGPNK